MAEKGRTFSRKDAVVKDLTLGGCRRGLIRCSIFRVLVIVIRIAAGDYDHEEDHARN